MKRLIMRCSLFFICLLLLSCPAGNYFAFEAISYKRHRTSEQAGFQNLKLKDSALVVLLGYYQSHVKSFKSGLYIQLESQKKDALLTKNAIQSIWSSKFGDLVPAYEPNYDSYINLQNVDSIYRIAYQLLPEYKALNSKQITNDTIAVHLYSGESVSFKRPF